MTKDVTSHLTLELPGVSQSDGTAVGGGGLPLGPGASPEDASINPLHAGYPRKALEKGRGSQ